MKKILKQQFVVFYKNKQFYDWLSKNKVDESLLEIIKSEINYLFENLNTDLIVCNKIYGRMNLLHKQEMIKLNEMNTSQGLFKIISALLYDKYYCKNSYISKSPIGDLTNDQIIVSYVNNLDKFSISGLNSYIDKMHLKKLDNYMAFIENISEKFLK